MASFQKRGKKWQYTVSHYVDGKPKHIRKGGFRTKKEAETAAAEVEYMLKKGVVPQVKEISFAAYFENWVELYKKGRQRSTYKRYLNSVDTVKDYFKDIPIQKITRQMYQEFLNWYGQGRAKETVRKLNTHIRSCVKDAIDDGLISIDFTRKAEFNGTKPAKKNSEKHLNFMDSYRLYIHLLKKIKTAKSNTPHLILLGLVSGLRYGELVGLTREVFNFDNNTIYIHQAWDYKEGIGKNGDGFTDLKNTASERRIGIDPVVMNIFKEHFENTPANYKDLVFFRPTEVKVLANESANKALKKILDELGIKTKISVHGLRHTHASVLLYKGVTIQSVSRRLGHASIETTYDYYTHIIKELEERDEKVAINLYTQPSVVNV